MDSHHVSFLPRYSCRRNLVVVPIANIVTEASRSSPVVPPVPLSKPNFGLGDSGGMFQPDSVCAHA